MIEIPLPDDPGHRAGYVKILILNIQIKIINIHLSDEEQAAFDAVKIPSNACPDSSF